MSEDDNETGEDVTVEQDMKQSRALYTSMLINTITPLRHLGCYFSGCETLASTTQSQMDETN